jgi:hypothetical protein
MRVRVALLLASVLAAGAGVSAIPAAGAWLSAVPAASPSGHAASSSSATTCGYIHASVPYTPHGDAARWRVYVAGATSCASAAKVLDAVMHLQARQHLGSSEADSYFTDGGWLCPFGNMGSQTCELPTRLPAHPPVRAHALALDCATPERGCPAHVPIRDL